MRADEAPISRVELDKRIARLTKLNVNPILAESNFRFTVPKGVKVVER